MHSMESNMTNDCGNQMTIPNVESTRDHFFSSSHRPPQPKNRDTHHAHERSNRFVIHEWEGLRNVPNVFEMTQVLTYLAAYTKIGRPRCLSRRHVH